MKQEFSTLSTVRHTAKHVYCCMLQYSSAQHVIANVKHLLE